MTSSRTSVTLPGVNASASVMNRSWAANFSSAVAGALRTLLAGRGEQLSEATITVRGREAAWCRVRDSPDGWSAGAAARLLIVSAPAGFGKTTLLTEWLTAQRPDRTERQVAWLSLDAADNEAASFWAYAIAALRTAAPGAAESARPDQAGVRPDAVALVRENRVAIPAVPPPRDA